MDVGAAFVADPQSAMLVQPGDGAFDDPTLLAETRAVLGTLLGDQRPYLSPPQVVARGLPLVAAVADDAGGAPFRPAAFAAHGRDRLDERDQFEAVVAVGRGEQESERDTARVGDQLVLGAALAPIDRARTGLEPPKTAGTCEESTTARDQSIRSASCSFASSTS